MRTLPGCRRRCGERRQERPKRIGLRQADLSAHLFLDDAPPIESGESDTAQLDTRAPQTALSVMKLGNDSQGDLVKANLGHGVYAVPQANLPPQVQRTEDRGQKTEGESEDRDQESETWNVLEGQPLRISVFAFDPDNPGFEPRIRLREGTPAIGEDMPASVTYQIDGLPEGARFDPETLEIAWTPGYLQAGSYRITVTATDDGDGTGIPKVSRLIVPIEVANANRAPEIGDIDNAFIDRGAVLDIPISLSDVDGNPIELVFTGLPGFARFLRTEEIPGKLTGLLRFTPGAGDRGDYTITVIATDDGDGRANQRLSQARSFVLTVQSGSEAPQIIAPSQVVGRVGEPISIALLAADLDQDELSWTVEGLPEGAQLLLEPQYGHATLVWTPAEADLGSREIVLVVADRGLPPKDAGYANPENPVPNVTRQSLRIVVREENAAPGLLGVQETGDRGQETEPEAECLRFDATEGVPWAVTLFAHDPDGDLIAWRAEGLPRGMIFAPAADGKSATFSWTPDLFAAQDGNTGTPGRWRFTVAGSDGQQDFGRTIEIEVANVNQTPVIPPIPLQLIHEGETLAFTIRGADADNDAVALALIHDETTPAGVFFNAATGSFEWTPDRNTVDNAEGSEKAFTFTFRASDGKESSEQTVQVRVFDVNRPPVITVSNHAVVIGGSLTLQVSEVRDQESGNGISVFDPDGATQTEALIVSFSNLPEGAVYDAQTRILSWTPGPGQIGDHVVTAQVSDGLATRSEVFVLRVAADEAQNVPQITVTTTPGTSALPGQTVLVTVRAEAFSGIRTLTAEVRDEAGLWQPLTLDAAGRVRLIPAQPGLLELRVTATDRDGFTSTHTHTILVKDPTDTRAPQLVWASRETGDGRQETEIAVRLVEAQLLGWRLELAPAGSEVWRTLAEADTAAVSLDQDLALATLDPRTLPNGVYRLRLTAWDLAGRTSEIETTIVIDSADKIAAPTVTDAVVTLAGHTLALAREWDQRTEDRGQKTEGSSVFSYPKFLSWTRVN